MVALYTLIYYPYTGRVWPVRVLEWYLSALTRLTAFLLSLFDPSVTAQGDTIAGRFSLRIVLDCAALDVQALFVAAVVAFPGRWPRKLTGLGVGIAVIALCNLGRIVLLYLVGERWPGSFNLVHEEVLPVVLVLVACAAFGFWARREDRSFPVLRQALEPGAGGSERSPQ